MIQNIKRRELFGRELDVRHQTLAKQNIVKYFSCSMSQKLVLKDQANVDVIPPYACEFCTVPENENLCAITDEEGYVSIIDTNCNTLKLDSHKETGSAIKVHKRWLSHNNAVFDIAWVHGTNLIATASGDTTAALWDATAPEKRIGLFRGHTCSLKSINVSKHNPFLLATGSRDGNVLVWDQRCNVVDGVHHPVIRIQDAHAIRDALTPQRKRRRARQFNNQLLVDSRQTVTSVIFQDPTTLVSAGAMDGTLKLWDLRKTVQMKSNSKLKNESSLCSTPKENILYPGSSNRRRGYTWLTLDSSQTRLFASCTDNRIYEYDLSCASNCNRPPTCRYSGHYSSSFYIRVKLSPDNLFLLSGCDDEVAYIWKTCQSQTSEDIMPSYCLKSAGMEQVTSVAWCPSDWTTIVTCSDDCAVRVWNIPTQYTNSQAQDGYCEQIKQSEKLLTVDDTNQKSPLNSVKVVAMSPDPSTSNALPSISQLSPATNETLVLKCSPLSANPPSASQKNLNSSLKKWLVSVDKPTQRPVKAKAAKSLIMSRTMSEEKENLLQKSTSTNVEDSDRDFKEKMSNDESIEKNLKTHDQHGNWLENLGTSRKVLKTTTNSPTSSNHSAKKRKLSPPTSPMSVCKTPNSIKNYFTKKVVVLQ